MEKSVKPLRTWSLPRACRKSFWQGLDCRKSSVSAEWEWLKAVLRSPKDDFHSNHTPWIFTLLSTPPSLLSVPLALLPSTCTLYSLTSVPWEFEVSGVLRETEGPPSFPKQPPGLRDCLGGFIRKLEGPGYLSLFPSWAGSGHPVWTTAGPKGPHMCKVGWNQKHLNHYTNFQFKMVGREHVPTTPSPSNTIKSTVRKEKRKQIHQRPEDWWLEVGPQLSRGFYLLLEDRRVDCNKAQMGAEESIVKAFLRKSCPKGPSRHRGRMGPTMGDFTP